jgi:glycosyltransferase involved in cell wall biosynthesis
MTETVLDASARSMRIAYFAGTMRQGHDGVTRVLYHLVQALNSRGIENIFFSPIIPDENNQPTTMFEVPSLAFPLYKDYRIALPGEKYFEEKLSSFKPDLIHINSPCSLGYAAAKFGQRHQIPVVSTYHTHFPSYAKYYRVKPLEAVAWNYFRKLYNLCQRTYVPSMPILQELSNERIENLKFLPHGVDTSLFHPLNRSVKWREEFGIGSRAALLFVGRLVWEKDLRTLVQTYQILKSRGSDVAFVLVGDGPAGPELKELMPEALFLGYRSGVELSTAYASSDMFVFPSTTETFGNVVLEAMASGLVPVCARQGGSAGIIQHGVTGLLTVPRDAADLASSIRHLLDHPGRRAEMADQAVRFARQQTWERIFDQLFEDYAAVLHEFHESYPRRQRKAA